MTSAPGYLGHEMGPDVSGKSDDFDSVADSVAGYLIEKLQEAEVSTKKYPDHYVLKNWISLNGPEELWKIILVMNAGDPGQVNFADHESFIASVEQEILRIDKELKEVELGQTSSTEDGFAIAS